MPNLRGSREDRRKLLAGVLNSVLLYGAPANDVESNKEVTTTFRRTQGRIAKIVICAYRTVASEAATILAGIIPAEILAQKYKRLYLRIKELQERGVVLSTKAKEVMKTQATEHAIATWRERSQRRGGYGRRVRDAVGPDLEG
ncbi:uncharacterized protein [Mycetomoellerius zeteki]|uniref:uncharacterized protein n=1 Tax=Mycetomoellerius zeteki TaxID=64791 RepID=UPI00084EC58E|nr:PREDICTED: uncharacterized protein LOC108728270 [Trachymyrmex zeteki]